MKLWQVGTLLTLGIVAFYLRLHWAWFMSIDTFVYSVPWLQRFSEQGLANGIMWSKNNYIPLYPTILWASHWIPMYPIYIIKAISALGDIWLCVTLGLFVQRRYHKPFITYLSALSTLFVPEMFLNSAIWGQVDALWVAPALLSIYALTSKPTRIGWFWFWLGVSFAFKIQAAWLAPLALIVLLITWRQEWRKVFIFCVPTLISWIPSLTVGVPVSSLVNKYFGQVSFYHKLSLNAPNFYIFLSNTHFKFWFIIGIILTLSLIVVLCWWGYRVLKVQGWREDLALKVACFSAMLIPFALPTMHERYFYLATSLLWLIVWLSPQWHSISTLCILQVVNVATYMIFIYQASPIASQQWYKSFVSDARFLSILMFLVLLYMLWMLLREAYIKQFKK